MTTTTASTTLPAGRYAIADPCLLVTESEWMELDLLRQANPNQTSFLLSDGSRLVIFPTDGDGWLFDQDSSGYAIDSGSLGIRLAADIPPAALARLDDLTFYSEESELPKVGAIHDFEHPFGLAAEAGPVFFIGHRVIAAE